MYFIRISLNSIKYLIMISISSVYNHVLPYYYFSVTLTDSVIVIERYLKDGKYFFFSDPGSSESPGRGQRPRPGAFQQSRVQWGEDF